MRQRRGAIWRMRSRGSTKNRWDSGGGVDRSASADSLRTFSIVCGLAAIFAAVRPFRSLALHCGFVADRDWNAAKNLERLAAKLCQPGGRSALARLARAA